MEDITWLTQGLENSPTWMRQCYIDALGRTGNARAVLPLCQALKDPQQHAAAAQALVRLGPTAVLPLCEVLKHASWDLRPSIAAALGRIGDQRAVLPLCEALRAVDEETRRLATVALGRIADARAVLPLCEALREGLDEAAVALGQIALRDPVPELRAALPVLRQRLRNRAGPPLAREMRRSFQVVIERIEAATAVTRQLPLPASAPPPSGESLPLPAGAPLPSSEGLPVPAEAGQSGSDNVCEPPNGTGAVERLRQTWRHYLGSIVPWLGRWRRF